MSSVITPSSQIDAKAFSGHDIARPQLTKRLSDSRSLEQYYEYHDLTPVIGREFPTIQLRGLLKTDDQVFSDLAYTVSSRGVVFLRNQDVTPNELKDFMLRLTTLAGCPATSGLHVHPLTEEGSELGDQISVISDITFEPVPSDHAMLKIHTLPATGGDTLWASGYEVYDRLSELMKEMLKKLTATHDAKFFLDEARNLGDPLRECERGSPLNKRAELTAVHPVIRTNCNYPFNMVTQNHDAQVQFRWEKNDVAIWDNRSTWHCATYDYSDPRAEGRVCSLGEAPYLDLQNGRLRNEELGR
ncbi:hypothetical protein QBC40DRAFT_308210 [Triangularia verruculosa]|uniref:TauD/TfdA-like domain-containing protein n=1 Tax=Triangularia verruculosa TaxID=2587418 RepID=A0AAN6XDD7_9PEZI|nr:hypothetical protein QBC40DRAFT_308210 [Triangularia verruculosa]